MIKLAQSNDGRLMILSNQPLGGEVVFVDWYETPRLLVLVLDDESEDIMPMEVDGSTAWIVGNAPDEVVIVLALPGEEPYGYQAQLRRFD